MEQGEKNNLLNNMAQLKWACRRGMLELDVLLGNFLERQYPHLALADKQLFVALLEYPDPELFAWLMGHETPADQGIFKITEMIRTYARSRI